ncbi:MAG: hypothetical protein KJI71_01535 [Patescibacteria group bacterium]|nr:hypothetical protein [Patescibacteria group bacterium]
MDWNEVFYVDCMDSKIGLPSLPDKSIELGYTDPVWNSDMKPNIRKFHNRELDNDKNKVFFNDKIDNFEEWTLNWFYQLERVCVKIVLVIPESSKYWWIRNTEPTGDAPVLWKNGFSGSKIANQSRKSTYLFYGKFEKGKKLKYDYIAKRLYSKESHFIEPFTLEWGFCSKEKHFIHPSPKGITVALEVLKQLKPESLTDPFAGSGSFLKAADILGIKWLGYENKPIYKQDIDKRFNQKTIKGFFEVD